MKPSLKKTLTGYVVKYACQCGEKLTSKISQVGAQDHCPACNKAFIVPGRDLVMDLKRRKEEAKAKAASEVEERSREKTAEKLAAKVETAPPTSRSPQAMPGLAPSGYLATKLVPTDDVDEDQLRDLSNSTARHITDSALLLLVLAIVVQAILIMALAYQIATGAGGFGPIAIAIPFLISSAVVWLVYFLIRVQLGLIAAVILMERNTRR